MSVAFSLIVLDNNCVDCKEINMKGYGFRKSDGTYHDDKGHDSQNIFTYGMFAKLLGLDVSGYDKIWPKCVVRVNKSEISFNRLPGLRRPPVSPEEALGAHVLNLISYDILKSNHFVFIGKGSRANADKIINNFMLAMVEFMVPRITIKGFSVKVHRPSWKDRNAWWKNNMQGVKFFASRLHPGLTYAIKKYNKKKFHNEEEKVFVFWRDCTIKSGNSTSDLSQKNLLWACLIMIGDHRRAKKLKPIQNFERYFGRDHVLTKGMKLYYQNR